eukprot:UC4_evm2s583
MRSRGITEYTVKFEVDSSDPKCAYEDSDLPERVPWGKIMVSEGTVDDINNIFKASLTPQTGFSGDESVKNFPKRMREAFGVWNRKKGRCKQKKLLEGIHFLVSTNGLEIRTDRDALLSKIKACGGKLLTENDNFENKKVMVLTLRDGQRTRKTLMGVVCHFPVVKLDWLLECFRKGKLMKYTNYLSHFGYDRSCENVELRQNLSRKSQVFRDINFTIAAREGQQNEDHENFVKFWSKALKLAGASVISKRDFQKTLDEDMNCNYVLVPQINKKLEESKGQKQPVVEWARKRAEDFNIPLVTVDWCVHSLVSKTLKDPFSTHYFTIQNSIGVGR